MTLSPWVHDPGLAPVWSVARKRLESNGVQPRGVVTVAGLDRAGRHAVAGLVGRPVLDDAVRVDLEVLDGAVRQRSGAAGLVDLIERLSGPLRNLPAERSAAAASREAPFTAARTWLRTRPDVSDAEWVEPFLAGVRRSRVLSRAPDAETASGCVVTALDVAARLLLLDPVAAVARSELAARVTGNAHALDDGTVLSQLVLRALTAAAGEEPPRTATGRRELWERHGVRPDSVSSTCLTLGLRPVDPSPLARRLRLAADEGDPCHLTAWDVSRADIVTPPGTWVLVCENPRVLQAVAERCAGQVCVVCTSGMPGLVTVDVLSRLASGGATLAYHGDFDWPGIAIANRMIRRVGCEPWRMSTADYVAAARSDGHPLEGEPTAAVWDDDLADAMRRTGTVVHEEAVLEDLLERLP